MKLEDVRKLLYIERTDEQTIAYFARPIRPLVGGWTFYELTRPGRCSAQEMVLHAHEAITMTDENWKRCGDTLKQSLPDAKPAYPGLFS